MRKVGGRLEMPMPAALDEFDPASRMAPRDGLDDRLHLPGGHFIAEAPGDLPRVERFVAGEQHRLYRAFQIVDHARCSTLRSEEHTSELQSLMRISYAVFCFKKKK